MDKDFSAYLEKIEAVLQNALPAEPDCLIAPIRDILRRGGKRWRPLLSLLVCEGSGGRDAVLPLVPLIEFSHTASLIHDDIEDNAPLRRGKPACHIIYGNDAAINVGSFLYFLASMCIDSWNANAKKKAGVFSLWTEYLRRLHTGQAYDIHWHNDFTFVPAVDDYLKMCAMKTGCLAAFAVDLACFVCGVVTEKKAALCNAARDLGVGFQIIDDVKNLRGGIAGKKRGDDIVEGKKSLPVILFLEQEGETGLCLVEKTFQAARTKGIDSPAIERLITAMEDSGAISQAQEQGNTLLDKAFTSFAAYPWTLLKGTQAAFRELRDQIENAASR
jgi:octaprenyl-diphosphate synthase